MWELMVVELSCLTVEFDGQPAMTFNYILLKPTSLSFSYLCIVLRKTVYSSQFAHPFQGNWDVIDDTK